MNRSLPTLPEGFQTPMRIVWEVGVPMSDV